MEKAQQVMDELIERYPGKPEYLIFLLQESFIHQINELGPIAKTDQNQEKLSGIYSTVKNARVRWVLGAIHRRPREQEYPGDQRNARMFDKDLLEILREEFSKARLNNLLRSERRYFDLRELASTIPEKQEVAARWLQEMVNEGLPGPLHPEKTCLPCFKKRNTGFRIERDRGAGK